MTGLSIIVPTYNECENIALLIERIAAAVRTMSVEWEILVVDDNSPDGTAGAARALSGMFPVRVVVRTGRRGLSRSVLEGFDKATGEFLLVMDADLSHPPERIPALWEAINRDACDLVVGSRYVEGGAIEHWPMLRRLTSRVSKLAVYPLTPVRDPLAGFFLVRKRIVEDRAFNPLGFKILLEILVKADCKVVREIPITFSDRLYGSSKLSQGVALAYFLQVTRLYAGKAVSLLNLRR